MPDIFSLFKVVMPDVSGNGFDTLLVLCALLPYRTILANVPFALVFPVSVPVGCCVFQHFVLRTQHTVVILIVNIFVPWQIALLRHGTLVRQRRNSTAVNDLFADPWCFVACIGCYDFNLGIVFNQAFKNRVKSNAVMDVSGCYFYFQHISPLFTDRMRFICKALLVLTLMKNAAIWIGGGLSDRLLF